MRTVSTIPPFLFDTDCLSSFLWANKLNILFEIFKDDIYIPQQVFDEVEKLKKFPNFSWVPELLDSEISAGRIKIWEIIIGSKEAGEYFALTSSGIDTRAVGKGEAAVMAIVKFNNGTICSNNLRDVSLYCEASNLGLVSTDDILCLAHEKDIITKDEGNKIWTLMKNKKRKLPAYDFDEAYRRFCEDLSK